MEARTASGSRTAAACCGCRSDEMRRPMLPGILVLLVRPVLLGKSPGHPGPGTSWAPGVRTGRPWSVRDSTGLSSASAASDQPRSHTDCQSRSGLWTRSWGSLSTPQASAGRSRHHRPRPGPSGAENAGGVAAALSRPRARRMPRCPMALAAAALAAAVAAAVGSWLGPVLPPGRGQLTPLPPCCCSAGWAGTSVMPLEPGVRRGNNVTGVPAPPLRCDVSTEAAGCAAACPAGTPSSESTGRSGTAFGGGTRTCACGPAVRVAGGPAAAPRTRASTSTDGGR